MSSRVIPLKVVTESPPLATIIPKPKNKIKIGPIQLNNSFSGQNYLPQSIGMIQAYAKKHLTHAEDYNFLLPLFTFMPINEAVEKLSGADLLVLSLYVWNFENSMAIAEEFKRRYPERLVVVGGPHVPDGKKQFQRIKKSDPGSDELKTKRVGITEKFHREHPCIDIAVHGEGERVFKMILERMAIDGLTDKSQIPSISYIDNKGLFHHNSKLERMRDLSEVPSPYLTGVFDPLVAAYPDQKWIAMWETDRGCPYQCTYCDWGGATEDKVSPFKLDCIRQEAWWFGKHKIPYIFLANANYGILKQDVEIAKSLAEVKRITGFPEGISVQNAKNPKPHTLEALEILEQAGLNKATVMSIQSKNRETLEAVRRENMKPEEYQANQKRLRAKGVFTMTDYIIPMPMETYDSVLQGISDIISDGQHDRIQFNNLSILPNAEMADPEYQEKYGMEMVRTPITNIHGKKSASVSGVEEYQDLVIATSTMSREEWVKTRTLCYAVALVYFNKLLQIPIMILHEIYGVSYKDIFEAFMEDPKKSVKFPVFAEILNFFETFSHGVQNGTQEEFYHSQECLDVLWPPDEYVFIKLCRENKLERFYEEAEMIMMNFVTGPDISPEPFREAVGLNRSLIKLPFQTTDLEITLNYNILDIYQSARLEEKLELQSGNYRHVIDRTTKSDSANTNARWDSWEEWYEKMVWWCNRRGAYLYGSKNPHTEIAGHH
ncbi:MAG: hypothetical protein A3I26_00380 [Candidatus Yanofskybacteria bacterium RIFCSPLOWO2_02_FULL_43_10]|uniref:Uncharacterized protein n=1 Tax=Candidatus Yanofskybacteria bacterium RIFCSPLOWO2_12_FULL_43_11b TaxID=1802710 RepID=A0A1F8H8P1_9BACT|nr:MAG: hypothetical protein A2742_00270 [Candidatus Yanofskybacteria bacterium RIFCSPHIGHO2_01_FULL_43_32]OGN10996.1 MAG: hypothetical protein A3C69_03410 [Candidatus Yanofskybacteria bacterium RIFCSPHIGHO2_02_FULL_43_12]OGN18147.1 MAG: hypothetical protein A3E34_02805 [Candidatus Yanofskybacteria bacterium RIFCSPHIGHO2_12_FULL_43_11]OGN24123.1 MAG: hypothetical protein A2923_02210 [Candidatus Yanofskybacteria bacterium RIFCSPLOWO2_01_FULL_43_46]OGN30560.1 MAG: hypothetical protein A3I26_00380